MTLLAKNEKQPHAVPIYSISYDKTLPDTDHIIESYQLYHRRGSPAWDGAVKSASYAATLTDAEQTIVTTAAVTLPAGATSGYRIYVTNASQSAAISVGAFTVPPRSAIVVAFGTDWFVEASTLALLISSPGDQRVRTWFYRGTDQNTYLLEVITTTNEGRVIADEIAIKVKEVK